MADADPDWWALVLVVLERAGFQVTGETIDGDDALATVARLVSFPVPTVMVLDNRIPGLSGLDVAERLLADAPGTRVILLSAPLNAEARQRARQIGISACLSQADMQSLPAVVNVLASL
jgi:two-component system chemotaxis response regulator CheY